MPAAEADVFGWLTIRIWIAMLPSKNFGLKPQVMERCGHVFKERLASQGSSSTQATYLTERQRQVLRSVALGYSTREIAQMLGVSMKAVHKQRERLRIALQLSSTAALTRFAVREGLVQESAASG